MPYILIGDHNWKEQSKAPSGQKKGLKPRDYSKYPRGCYKNVAKVDITPFPESEWSERLRDQTARKGRVSDIMRRAKVPCLDQNGRGYCWGHSTTGAVMAVRAIMNQPTVGLSAYSTCCWVKNFRDEGGWGAESADFISERGVCDETHWPQRGTSRSLDNADNKANALNYRILGQWADMQEPQYDRNLTFAQYVTLWLSCIPTVNDYNWWGHSVMGCDAVEGKTKRRKTRDKTSGKLVPLELFEKMWGMNNPVTKGWGCTIRNSWGESWGDIGFGDLASNKAVPDGGLGLMMVLPS